MALYQGDNVAFTIDRRTVVESGTDPALFPAPDEFLGAFTGGRILLQNIFATTWAMFLIGPLYTPQQGPGRQGNQIVELARSLDAGEFASEITGRSPNITTNRPIKPVVFGGTVPADLGAVSSPGLRLGIGTGTVATGLIQQVAGIGDLFTTRSFGSGAVRRRLAGASGTQDAAWIVFQLHQGTLEGVTSSLTSQGITGMTVAVDAAGVRSRVIGPMTQRTGRIDVEEVQVLGTRRPGVVELFQGVQVDVNRPVLGEQRVIGIATMDSYEADDLDGDWTIGGQEFTLWQSDRIERGRARVVLTKRTGA